MVGERSAARAFGSAGGERTRLAGAEAIDDRRERREQPFDFVDVAGGKTVGGRVGGRDGFEELADGDRERAGEADEHIRARLGLPEFDAPDVFVVQVGALGERFL